jgi:hypothetical protein
VSAAPADVGSITVVNDYPWVGDPRLAATSVYLDRRRRRAGVAPVRGRLDLEVSPGNHEVRVRIWWFRSPKLLVEVKPGTPCVVRADKPHGTSGGATLRLAFRPLTAWSLTPDHTGTLTPESATFTATDERRRRVLLRYAIAMLGVFVLIALLAK